jgi:hypothetical protein
VSPQAILRALRNSRSASVITIRALRAVLNHALEDERIDVAPKFKIQPGANVRSWILLPEQVTKDLPAFTELLKTGATIILDARLRPGGCFRPKWENVKWIDDKPSRIDRARYKDSSGIEDRSHDAKGACYTSTALGEIWKADERVNAWTLVRLAGHKQHQTDHGVCSSDGSFSTSTCSDGSHDCSR